MAQAAAASPAATRFGSSTAFLDRMLDAGGGAFNFGAPSSPAPGLPDGLGLPTVDAHNPLAFGPADGQHGSGIAARSAGGTMFGVYDTAGGGLPESEPPLRSISDPTQRRSSAAATRQAQTMPEQLQDLERYPHAAAPLLMQLHPLRQNANGSGVSSDVYGGALDRSTYAAYCDAAMQQYQDPPSFVPGPTQFIRQHTSVDLGGAGSGGLRGALPSSGCSQQQQPDMLHSSGMPGGGGLVHVSSTLGQLQREMAASGCCPQPTPPLAHPFAPAPGSMDSWGAPKIPWQQQLPPKRQLLHQQVQQPGGGAGRSLPGASGGDTGPFWPPDLAAAGGFGSSSPGHPAASAMSFSSGEGSHDSAAGQPLTLSSWRSPLDAAQAVSGFLHPLDVGQCINPALPASLGQFAVTMPPLPPVQVRWKLAGSRVML